jgi:hypothetical protein
MKQAKATFHETFPKLSFLSCDMAVFSLVPFIHFISGMTVLGYGPQAENH